VLNLYVQKLVSGDLVIKKHNTIYYKVWTTILNEFNIEMNPDIFKNYIQGNNDTYVRNSLLVNINILILYYVR
jgi:hypothetical protein